MPRIQYYQKINSITDSERKACIQGKCCVWRRSFVITDNNRVAVVSLNFFERILRYIFCINYFNKIFASKNVRIIPSSELCQTDNKTVEVIKPFKEDKQTNISNNDTEKEKKSQQLENNITVQNKVEKEVESSTQVEPLINLPKIESQKFDREEIKRIITHHISSEENRVVNLPKLEKLFKAFEEYKLDSETQIKYGNQNTDKIIVMDVDNFWKAYDLFYPEIEVFIRYLIMEEKVFGFSQVACRYRLYLIDPGIQEDSQPIFTKEHLLKIDDYMKKLELPKKTEFSSDEWETVKQVLEKVRESHYHRVANNNPGLSETIYGLTGSGENLPILDSLIMKGIISAWNVYTRTQDVVIKIKETDTPKSEGYLRWTEWRDQAVIQNEEKFRKENNIVIRESDKQEMLKIFTSALQVMLNDLIKDLNHRINHGVYNWYPGDKIILQELKKYGYIHDYEQTNLQRFKVYVKPEDKN